VKEIEGGGGLCSISQCPFNIALLFWLASSTTEKGQWTKTCSISQFPHHVWTIILHSDFCVLNLYECHALWLWESKERVVNSQFSFKVLLK